jgi:ribonuclease D
VQLVTDAGEVEVIARALAAASLVAFDLEFASADRLVPQLCLVQVAWLPDHVSLDAPPTAIVATVPEVRLVDPLAVDVAPIARALAVHPVVVAHAPRQDLQLLAALFGTGSLGLVDTQLAAAFAGLGDQLGLATLAGEVLGLALAKEQQWTNWAARPLSDAQLAYADADVRHLPALYARLAARLGSRMAWVREESARVVDDARTAAGVGPEDAWRQIGGLRTLDDDAHDAARELAAWRQRVAIELDRPLGQVMTDKLIVELARTRPVGAAAVRAVKGLSPHARARADAIVAALGVASTDGAPSAERRTRAAHPRSASTRAQRWAEMLIAIVQVIADDTGIAPRLLATRADAEELARVVDERGIAAAAQLPAFATWRREVLGPAWEGWLTGRVALVGDVVAAHGVRLAPR